MILALVPVTVPTLPPLINTSYPVTPTLSEDAFQDRVVVVWVVLEAVKFVGLVGAWVSPPPPPPSTQNAVEAEDPKLPPVTIVVVPLESV